MHRGTGACAVQSHPCEANSEFYRRTYSSPVPGHKETVMNNDRVNYEQQAHEKSKSKIWKARLWTCLKWAIRLFKLVWYVVKLFEGCGE